MFSVTVHFEIAADPAVTRTLPTKPPFQELATVNVAEQAALPDGGGLDGGGLDGGGVVGGGLVGGGLVGGGLVGGGLVGGGLVGGGVVPPLLRASRTAV